MEIGHGAGKITNYDIEQDLKITNYIPIHLYFRCCADQPLFYLTTPIPILFGDNITTGLTAKSFNLLQS